MRVKTSDQTAVRIRLQQRDAAQQAGVRSPLDVSRKCENPVLVNIDGAPDEARVRLGAPDRKVFAELLAPCRRCPACLSKRRQMWGARGAAETAMSLRTWFGTLTARPEVQLYWLATARRVARVQGLGDYDALPSADQFRLLVKQSGRELTLWLKRVRKESGVPLRYFAVAEQHRSGLPHWHILVHEVGPPVGKRLLEGHWRSGFSQWRLVKASDPKAAFYCAKYLAKSAESRVRASASYGHQRIAGPVGVAKPHSVL